MSRRASSLADQPFGRLTAVRPTQERRWGSIVWLCRCSCGRPDLVPVPARDLVQRHTKSCGCLLMDGHQADRNVALRELVNQLKAAGQSNAAIGRALHISRQRVWQLLQETS